MPKPEKTMVFGYVRVSTENQLENYSIEEQVSRIKAYCKAKGWLLLKIYTDGGFSGGNTERPALQEMLSAVRTSNVSAVVVYKLDRLSRSQKDTLTLIEDEFLAHETDFVSINENFDTSSPFGRAMIGILSVFAQLEKDQITERFTMGRIGRSKAGYYHGGGVIPLGYNYVEGKLIVDEFQAEQIREIFRRFLAGESINHIWHAMAGKYPGFWSAPKISVIIRNSLYIGKVKYGGAEYDGLHQPIISKEDYAAANALLKSSSRKEKMNTAQKTPFRAETLLSGLTYCAHCGARYSGNHGLYRCYSRSKSCKKYIIDPHCKNDHWVIPELDNLIVDAIRGLLRNNQILQNTISQAQEKSAGVDTSAIKKRLAEIDSQTAKLVDLYQVSAIPIDTLTQRINAMNIEAVALRNQLEEAATDATESVAAFSSALERFKAEFDDASLSTQRLLVGMLVKKIILDEKDVKIEWRV